jgi:hypothetical protein
MTQSSHDDFASLTAGDTEAIVLAADRFRFLLRIMAESTGVPPAEIVRDLDEMIAVEAQSAAIRAARRHSQKEQSPPSRN